MGWGVGGEGQPSTDRGRCAHAAMRKFNLQENRICFSAHNPQSREDGITQVWQDLSESSEHVFSTTERKTNSYKLD